MRKFAVGLAGVVLVSCGVFGASDDEEAPPAGPPPSVAAPGESAPPIQGTSGVDENEITESYGVFVSPQGAQDGDGTRTKPLATIAAGLERAVAEKKRLYVCVGTFKEAVKVVNGIPIVGGLDCSRADWKPNGARTRIESPASPALVAEAIDKDTRIEALEVIAPDGTDASPTSIGLHAKNANKLFVVKSKIVAGKGKDGADGTDGPQLTLGASARGKDGGREASATSTSAFAMFPQKDNGGAGGVGACEGAAGFAPGGGGKGGQGGSYDSEYSCRGPGGSICGYWLKLWAGNSPVFYPAQAGVPLVATPGTAGADGASATVTGKMTAEGYAPSDGTAGTNGTEGSGGSGGGGRDLNDVLYNSNVHIYVLSASGPGGGAGGCPGLAGTPGKGGHASIGAFIVGSEGLVLDATEIVASAGGAGGKGTFGSSPTLGGAAGTAFNNASPGAPGAAGGRSGVSGSGGGGPSYGIASTGGAPVLNNGSVAKAGPPGAGVAELTTTDAVGNAKTIPASVAGEAKDELSF